MMHRYIMHICKTSTRSFVDAPSRPYERHLLHYCGIPFPATFLLSHDPLQIWRIWDDEFYTPHVWPGMCVLFKYVFSYMLIDSSINSCGYSILLIMFYIKLQSGSPWGKLNTSENWYINQLLLPDPTYAPLQWCRIYCGTQVLECMESVRIQYWYES